MKHFILSLCLLMAFRLAVQAEISLPAIFGDNMVLQQNTEVKIWGTSDSRAGISVTCSWDNRTYETTADASGKWSAVIETPPAGGPYRITVVDMAGDGRIIPEWRSRGEIQQCRRRACVQRGQDPCIRVVGGRQEILPC